VREAARLHEVGKIYVRDESHPAAGCRLARGAGVPELVCEWILHCTERFDAGEGARAAGSDIPLPSRIIAAACEYDVLLGAYTGGSLAGRRWALIGVIEEAGKLDPMVVDALARVVERASEGT